MIKKKGMIQLVKIKRCQEEREKQTERNQDKRDSQEVVDVNLEMLVITLDVNAPNVSF